MNTVRKLEDRRFVIFDAAQIDVNSIVALAYQLQNVNSLDKDNKPTTVQVQVAVLMLDTGGSITLGSDGLKKFEIWWKKNVEAEKIDLPVEVVTEVVPLPVAANLPAAEPVAPEKVAPEIVAPVKATLETTAPDKTTPDKTAPDLSVAPPLASPSPEVPETTAKTAPERPSKPLQHKA